MNALQILDQREVLGQDFRVYGDADNPLFLAKDVAAWIEHTDVSTMMRTVDDDEKVTNNVCTLGGIQESWFLCGTSVRTSISRRRATSARSASTGAKGRNGMAQSNGAMRVT